MDELPERRFKYQSHASELKGVHLPSALNQSQRDHDFEDSECQFHDALLHWRQLNLSPSFILYANKSQALSASLPLLLHNWREVVDLWIAALKTSDDEGLKALLDLIQKIIIDLRGTLSPAYIDILNALLNLLPRSIAAAPLTTLLSTFTLLFKHLLVPSTELTLLDSTWTSVHSILPKCHPEIQRAMAEVWGALLRRLKSSTREHAVLLTASNFAGIEDAAAWVFVSASKSVSQTLHTAVPSIITPLVTYYIACPDDANERTYTLVRRVLTALIHHVKNADGFSPISDVLCAKFVDDSRKAEPEVLRRLCEVLAVSCSVRHGSRMSGKQLSAILPCLHEIPITSSNFSAMLKLSTAVIYSSAGDMSLWMGLGRRYLEYVWSLANDGSEIHVKYALEIHGILVEMGWGGWKMIALPVLLKRSIPLLEVQSLQVLRLLSKVKEEGKLGEVDVVWKRGVEAWLKGRLSNCTEFTDTLILELSYAFKLSSFVSEDVTHLVTTIVANILNDSLSTEDVQKSSRMLALCLQYVAERPHSEWSKQLDIAFWTSQLVSKWSNSPDILSALTELREASDTNTPIPFEEAYTNLRGSLLSHDSISRLNALRILCASSGAPEVANRCLIAEEVVPNLGGARERVLKTSRVTQGELSTEVAADFCARWLLAQLKVNFKPLWKTAATTLAELARSAWGDVVWSVIWDELQAIKLTRGPQDNDQGDSDETRNIEEDEDFETERTWRDPSAHKHRTIVQKWQTDVATKFSVAKRKDVNARFQGRSYVLGVLDALGHCPSIAEKHNRDLVPFFLSLKPVLSGQRQHFVAYLTLFAKFSNPKACYQSEQLQCLYLDLLAHPDRNLQAAALSCLLTYKNPSLVQWQEKLRVLLDSTRWRDELTTLELETADSEVACVVIRMLYGIMLERKGKSRRGNERRATILGVLGACSEGDLEVLVQLMLKSLDPEATSSDTDKQRIGFLTLLGDVLKNLGSRLVSYWPLLLQKTLDLAEAAQLQLGSGLQEEEEADEDDADEDEKAEGPAHVQGTKGTRVIRQLAIKRFTDFFRIPVEFDFDPYVKIAFATSISPRIPLLDKENTQSPSALLELFSIWSQSPRHAIYLTRYDTELLPKIFDCLLAVNVKPAVISKVFDVTERLLDLASEEPLVLETVVRPNIGHLLTNMAVMAEQMKGVEDAVAQRQINVLSQIAQYSTDREEAKTLFKLFAPLLRKSHKIVAEKIKADILKIMSHLIPFIPELADSCSEVFVRLHATFSQLFLSLRQRPARLSLVGALHSLAAVNPSLQALADLMEEWNSYSQKRMDEPDFDRRLKAFAVFQSTHAPTLSLTNWSLVLHQTLYSIHDPDELAIRTSSSSVLRQFIDLVVSTPSPESEVAFVRVVFAGLKNGLRSKNELVRSEILGVLSYSVQKCENISAVQDMRILLAAGDEEANFFNNIQHIQIHRRSRAIRRLAEQCDEQPLRSGTLAELIIPLVGTYIVAPTTVNHHLVNDAITTTGRLSKHLAWGAYYALVQKYLRLAKTKDDAEKVNVRTVVSILDNFHFKMEEPIAAMDGEEGEDADPETVTFSADSRVSIAVNNRLLPELLKFIESRDATTEDTTRIPIATGIVRVAMHLPADSRETQITRLLTVTSQVLRSKSQETRDLVRETLAQIAVTLGPSYLRLMILELRGALLRGPHLHILAYTTHSLLTHVTSDTHASTFQNLDDCVSDVAHVASEVVFGESGKDVQAEDFKTKMREVRGSASKGFDTFTILARHITAPYITGILLPLRSILHTTATTKTLGAIDEALKRIVSGLNGNSHLDAEQLLSVCHSLISQNAKFLNEAPLRRKSKNKDKGDAIVQIKRQEVVSQDHFANNSYRFVVLGLELFQTTLRRNRFDFRDGTIISKLESMLVVIGNSLYSNNSPVLIMGLKCISALVKCPLRSWAKSLPVLTRQTIEIIKQAGSTESDLVQAALKSLAVILRDGPAADVREKDLTFLLELISPDLEDPARQATVFTVLRAIVSRKFVVPEIYDLMEKVSEVMVTSQSAQVQELCRGLLLQFLLDYPQGKGRLRNQMTFLAKNLSYVHETGRKSVMEILGALIAKFQSALVQEYADLLFVALVMVIANDESAKCVEIASQLVKTLLVRLDEERRTSVVSHLHTWALQVDKPRLSQISSQVYGIFVDALGDSCQEQVSLILEDVNRTLQTSAAQLEAAEADDDAMVVDLEWQPPYYALIVISKILAAFPALANVPENVEWESTVNLLLFPHPWVRTAACRLLGVMYGAAPISAPAEESLVYPLSKVGMLDVAKKLALQLKSQQLDEALGLQIVKNLFYLGKCFSGITSSEPDAGDEAEDEDEDAADPPSVDDPLPWLFSKLSYQARSAHISRRNRQTKPSDWGHQPLAILRWFAAMASFLDAAKVERFLVHILSPVYRFIEDDTIRDPHMDEVKTLSTELQDLIQSKVGATAFSKVYNQIRQGVLGVRRERKTMRALQVATNPEAAAKRKLQKNGMKKDSRKRKNEAFADNRGSLKRSKEW